MSVTERFVLSRILYVSISPCQPVAPMVANLNFGTAHSTIMHLAFGSATHVLHVARGDWLQDRLRWRLLWKTKIENRRWCATAPHRDRHGSAWAGTSSTHKTHQGPGNARTRPSPPDAAIPQPNWVDWTYWITQLYKNKTTILQGWCSGQDSTACGESLVHTVVAVPRCQIMTFCGAEEAGPGEIC